MPEKSIIIIGAGLAGLSCGIYARMNGYKAHIFEHHHRPGGVVAAWKRKGFTIDGGVHFMMGHKPGQPVYDLYKELGVIDYVPLLELENFADFLDQETGLRLSVSRDIDRFRERLKELSPKDAKAVDALFDAAHSMRGADMLMGMDQPVELLGTWGMAKQMWTNRKLFKYLIGRFNKPVEEYVKDFHDPLVKDIILHLFLPEVPAWFIIMLLAMHADGQIGQLGVSSLDFARGLERRYKELGGEITYKATVEKIMVEDDRAVGIKLNDGTESRGNVIVSAADGRSTIYKMLGGRYTDKKTDERYEKWDLCRPLITASFGVDREFPGEPYMQLVKLKTPFTLAGEEKRHIFVRVFNYTKDFAPEGKGVLQVTAETQWEFWSGLREKDQDAYNAEKERFSNAALEKLETLYPGISDQVEVTDVCTPYTYWRYTKNHKGAYEGWLITPKTIMTRIDRTLPGLDNFYMAGQWVTPGGGVPPCLYSGRQVIQVLCHKEGKTFTVSTP
jgi:phytoene dehydrogenase-like protein